MNHLSKEEKIIVITRIAECRKNIGVIQKVMSGKVKAHELDMAINCGRSLDKLRVWVENEVRVYHISIAEIEKIKFFKQRDEK